MAKLTLTRGYSGSGKSYWANQQDALVVSRDHIRQQITGHQTKTVLNNDGEQLVTKLETAQIEVALKAGVNVISDNTNLRAKFARRYIDLAVQHGAEWEVKDFPVDAETCKKQNWSRWPNGVEQRVIEDQARRFPLGTWPVLEPSTPKVSWEPYVPDTSLPTAYIFDIDGTLAELAEGYSPYDPLHYPHDKPIEHVVRLLRRLSKEFDIVLLTGREGTNDAHRATVAWLREHDIPWTELHMRYADDSRNDAIIKSELFDKHIAWRYNVLGVFDDRLRVRRMWYARGVPLFSVGDPDSSF